MIGHHIKPLLTAIALAVAVSFSAFTPAEARFGGFGGGGHFGGGFAHPFGGFHPSFHPGFHPSFHPGFRPEAMMEKGVTEAGMEGVPEAMMEEGVPEAMMEEGVPEHLEFSWQQVDFAASASCTRSSSRSPTLSRDGRHAGSRDGKHAGSRDGKHAGSRDGKHYLRSQSDRSVMAAARCRFAEPGLREIFQVGQLPQRIKAAGLI